MTTAVIVSHVLREPRAFLDEIRDSKGLAGKAVALLAVSTALFAFHGVLLGSATGGPQALVSAIKLPILFLLTMAICFPTLHLLNLLYGSRHSTSQLAVLLLATVTVTGVISAAFFPIIAFFLISSSSYLFYKLLNIAVLGFAAVYGLRFLFAGMRHLQGDTPQPNTNSILKAWLFLYVFVGCQLAWVTRPFFGAPNLPFEVFRSGRGNFYTDVKHSVEALIGFDD